MKIVVGLCSLSVDNREKQTFNKILVEHFVFCQIRNGKQFLQMPAIVSTY